VKRPNAEGHTRHCRIRLSDIEHARNRDPAEHRTQRSIQKAVHDREALRAQTHEQSARAAEGAP